MDKKEMIKNLYVFSRDIRFDLTKNFIISLVGPRRSGKTYFLYDLIKNKLKLADEDYLFMDFEDAELEGVNFKDILEAVNLHEEYYGKKPEYIFRSTKRIKTTQQMLHDDHIQLLYFGDYNH